MNALAVVAVAVTVLMAAGMPREGAVVKGGGAVGGALRLGALPMKAAKEGGGGGGGGGRAPAAVAAPGAGAAAAAAPDLATADGRPSAAAAAPGAAPAGAATEAASAGAAAGASEPRASEPPDARKETRPAGAAASAPAAPAGAAAGGAADAEALARGFRTSGQAVAVERAGASLFPYGHGRAVLRCAPLRACVIELESGESVLSTASGDSERWVVQAAASGPGGRTPLVIVKPVACDLTTNLVIATDRRLYEVALDSPPCRDADAGQGGYNPRLPYTGILRFYFPDELVRRWAREEELARRRAEEESAGATPLAAGARLANLNFDYTWRRDRKFPWAPAQVFDDGEHTYIVLPKAARFEEAPALFAVGADGKTALLNYHLERQTFVADRVLGRAVLVVGSGRRHGEQRLEIENRARGGR